MADNVIDSLSLEISANSSGVDKAIDKIANSLLKLEKSMGGFQKYNFNDLSGGMKRLANASKSLDIGKISNYAAALKSLGTSINGFASNGKKIEPAIRNLEKLAGFDFSRLQVSGDFSGFAGLAKGADEFAAAAVKLAQVKPTEINRTIKAFEKLNTINLNGLAQGMAALNGLDFSALNNLGTAFQGFSSALAGSDKVPANTAKIFNSLAQLTTSAGNISAVQQYLPILSSEIQRFVSAMAQVPAVQPGTSVLVTALSGIANAGGKIQKVIASLPGLTSGIHDFIVSLSSLPSVSGNTLRAVEALAKIAPVGAKAGSAAKSLQKNIMGLSSTMNNVPGGAKKALSGLKAFASQALGLLGIAGGIYAVGNAVKSSISYAGNLVEAQNVVNQGFGSLVNMADDFATTALRDFGMSELAAKQTAGQFAAMGKALGLVPEAAAEMSLSLTGLTGDLASFWNVSQDVARTALASVFTGETESLKKFGVVMTETNLRQFAYSQGITKSISAMTQAEKTQLRYAYVMEQTAVAQGDFASTSGNWANQIRLLTGQFQTLAGIIGNGLVAAFLPVVKAINTVMAKIIQLASVLSAFASKLFGIEGPTVGAGAGLADMSSSAGSVADNMEDAAGGISDVGGAAGKAKKKLNGFIASWHEVNNMTSNDDSGAGGGAGGVSIPEMALPSEYEMQIVADDEVSPVLDRIRSRFTELGSLFQKGFKVGLGDTSVFDSIKQNLQSIKESLIDIFTDEGVINGFNNLLDTLAYNAGVKIGAFTSIGATIIDNITGGAALYLDSAKERISEYLVSMFDITGETDTIVTNFIAAIADIFTVFRTDRAKQVTADIIQVFSDGFLGATELAAKLGRDILGTILNPITENAGGFKEALQNTLGPIEEILGTLADSFTHLWESINQMYDEHIEPMFGSFTSGISKIVGSLLDGYNEYIVPVLEGLAERFTEVWNGTIEPLLDNFVDLFGDLADLVKTVWENIFQPVINWVAQNIMPAVSPVLDALGNSFLDVFQGIGQVLDGFITTVRGVVTFLTGTFSGDWETAWEGIKTIFKGIWDAMPDFVKAPIRDIIGLVNKMIEGIEGGINYVVRALNSLSIEIPDWVPEFGGKTFGFDLDTVSLGRIPQLARGGIVDKATLALIGESGPEAVVPLERNAKWISAVAANMSREFGNLSFDFSVPQPDFTPKSYDLGAFRSTMQMEMDAQMAQYEYETRQQNELLREQNELLRAIYKKPALADDDIFNSARRGQQKFQRRTFRTGWAGID